MAFHTAGDGTAGIGRCTAQDTDQILHDPAITAAVTADGFGYINGPHLGDIPAAGPEMDHRNGTLRIVSDDLAVFTHDMDIAVYLVGLRGEGEGGGDAIVKLHDDAHMIADIIVAAEDATAVRAGFQGGAKGLFGLLQTNNLCRPGTQSGLLRTESIKTAVFPNGTVTASVGRTGGSVFGFEIGKIAKGGNFCAMRAREPE